MHVYLAKLLSNYIFLGDTYPSWPSDFQWVTDMMVYTTLKGIGYRCAHFHEPNDETYWMDNYLCWKGDPYLKAKITFRSSGMSEKLLNFV